MAFDAVIFDLDGTLIDTERPYLDTAFDTLTALGHRVERAFLVSLVGYSDTEGNRRLRERIGAAFDEDAFMAAWSVRLAATMGQDIPALPGAADLLERLAGASVPVALATNSATASALGKLKRAGLEGWFHPDRVFGRDRVGRPKPAPDLYLAAAAALGARPARCLAFEDSHAGVDAARAAGMTVVQVAGVLPHPHPEAHIQAEGLMDGARCAGLLV